MTGFSSAGLGGSFRTSGNENLVAPVHLPQGAKALSGQVYPEDLVTGNIVAPHAVK